MYGIVTDSLEDAGEQLRSKFSSLDELRMGTAKSEYEPYESNEHFSGFEKGHILVTGTTGSGKTTTLITLIYKNTIRIPPNVVLFLNEMAIKNQMQNYINSISWAYFNQNQGATSPPKFYLFKSKAGSEFERYNKTSLSNATEVVKIINDISEKESNEHKSLIIIEDTRVAGDLLMKNVQSFLLGAKNAGSQVVVFDHTPTKDKLIQGSINYIIMATPSEQEFNVLVHETMSAKVIDERYNNIVSKQGEHQSSFIYNKLNQKLYWAYATLPLVKAI